MKNRVISTGNMPAKYPIQISLISYIFCDYYNAREWVWTFVIIFLALLWILSIVGVIKQNMVDIFEEEKSIDPEVKPRKSKFQERLDNYMATKK